MGKCTGSGQGCFLSSFKASASGSKFLMTTSHLKSSLALKEANFDSTASQDNLARKLSDEFSILFFFFYVGGEHEKNAVWNKNRNKSQKTDATSLG